MATMVGLIRLYLVNRVKLILILKLYTLRIKLITYNKIVL